MLTDQEVYKIFSWQPYREDWIVDRNQTDDKINSYYGNLIKNLTQHTLFDTHYSEDGGTGNYLEFMCYPGGHREYHGNAILVCVSLCAPYAAYGQITIFKEQHSFGWGYMFSPDKAYKISDVVLKEIEDIIKQILQQNNCHLLNKEFLSRQLPGEVVEDLKHENHNEGTQYFHGLFQKID
jgi:hypothetical protein